MPGQPTPRGRPGVTGGLAFAAVTQLHDLTALEQAAAVRAREVSPTELVEHALDRIDALDPGIGVVQGGDRGAGEVHGAMLPRRR